MSVRKLIFGQRQSTESRGVHNRSNISTPKRITELSSNIPLSRQLPSDLEEVHSPRNVGIPNSNDVASSDRQVNNDMITLRFGRLKRKLSPETYDTPLVSRTLHVHRDTTLISLSEHLTQAHPGKFFHQNPI